MSWMTLQSGTRIATSDGDELGKVAQVVADLEKGIFSGITFKSGLIGSERFVPADLIDGMSEKEVTLTVSAADAEGLIKDYEG